MYSNIVYVAGCENNGTTEVVKYWKNERALALTGIFVLIHKTNERGCCKMQPPIFYNKKEICL